MFLLLLLLKRSSCVWICPSCGLPSFTSSFFDATSLTSPNSFSTLSQSTENIEEAGTPLKASTPTKCTPVGHNNGSVKVLSVNINSLRGKTLQILDLIHMEHPDIVMCQETKIDQHVLSSELFPDSFTIFRKDRNLTGGGVCIALKKSIQAVQCHDLDVDGLEAIWVYLTPSSHKSVYLCSIY